MSEIELRPYQRTAVASAFNEWAEHDSTLIVMPTGTGKSVVFADIISRVQPKRALVLAHRSELIFQAVRHVEKVGLPVAVEMADLYAEDCFWSAKPIVVSTVQTQIAGNGGAGRMARFDPFDFGLVICDEAHHFTASSFSKVLNHYRQNPDLKILGVTATPDRADEQALGQVFQSVAYDYEILDAINDGWLVPIEQQMVTIDGLDFSSIRTTAGDLNNADLAAVMESEKNLHGIVSASLDIIGDRRTLVFAVTVKQAEMYAEIFNRHKPGMADWVCGKTPKDQRHETFRKFGSGDTQILVNVGVACLDDQTEILTSGGWVGHDVINPDHEIANWDDGIIHFARPLAIEVRDRRPDERMIVLETKNRSIRVTDDHRMLYRTTQDGRFHVARAHELIGRKAELPICGHAAPLEIFPPQESPQSTFARRMAQNTYTLRRGGMKADEARIVAAERIAERDSLRFACPSELTEDQCSFIGFWLGDGSKTKLQSGGVEYLAWQAASYPNIIAWLDSLIERMGIDVIKRTNPARREGGSPVIEWAFSRGTGFGDQKRKGLYSLEPYLNKQGADLLWGLNDAQFAALCGGFWMADGEHYDAPEPTVGTWRICNTNWQLLDLLQAIACCRGYRANISDGKTNTQNGHKPLWRLSISRRDSHAMTKYKLEFEPGWKAEKVWCVKSHTGFIVTRRRGTVTITGNTEGYDNPAVEVIVQARPTKSRCLYSQMVGRATRPLPGLVDRFDTPEERRFAMANSAKPNCIAEGELILTDAGLVPIEDVTLEMKVWDGVEFVSHCGTIFRGEQRVITYAGLTATPDHEVWTDDETGSAPLLETRQTFGRCADEQIAVRVTGIGGQEVREVDGYFRRGGAREAAAQYSVLDDGMRMWKAFAQRLFEFDFFEGGLPHLWTAGAVSSMALESLRGSAPALLQSERSKLREIWRSRHSVWFRFFKRYGFVGSSESWAAQGNATRPNQQRRELRTGQSSLLNDSAKLQQQAWTQTHARDSRIQDCSSGSKFFRRFIEAIFPQWIDMERNSDADAARSVQRKARVFDILNAGPRHRFTAQGLLVSNCLVIDFVGNSGRHKLITTADILGGKVSDEAIERAVAKAKAKGKAVNMADAVNEEERLVQKEIEERKRREAARKARIVGKAQFSTRYINPFDVFQMEPARARGWDNGRSLSEKQAALLRRQGLDPSEMTYSQGRQVLSEMFRRWDSKLCTLKQANLLRKHGYETKDLPMAEASKLIDALAKNGWQRPRENAA